MTGFVLLLVIGAGAFGALTLLRVPHRYRSMVGAALMLGGAGYAWQGRPGLVGTPALPNAGAVMVEPALVDLRERMMGRFTADAAFFTAAEALLRIGDADSATQVMMGGVRSLPRSYMMWTGLGSTLAIRDANQVSPATLLAFRQAIRLAPRHPAPFFYLGLAYVRAGNLVRGRAMWRRAVTLSPPGVSYRRDLAILLAIIERTPDPVVR